MTVLLNILVLAPPPVSSTTVRFCTTTGHAGASGTSTNPSTTYGCTSARKSPSTSPGWGSIQVHSIAALSFSISFSIRFIKGLFHKNISLKAFFKYLNNAGSDTWFLSRLASTGGCSWCFCLPLWRSNHELKRRG